MKDESIILKMTAQNVNLDAADELNLTLLLIKKTLTLNENPLWDYLMAQLG
jgi:hypothetical protein